MDEAPRLGVVLVNWNGWSDTSECLESVLRSTIPLNVVVVDNASSNGSSDRIVEWAGGSAQPADDGAWREARAAMEAALAITPDDPDLVQRMGDLYLVAGRRNAAPGSTRRPGREPASAAARAPTGGCPAR